MAGKVLLGSWSLEARTTICLRGKRACREYRRNDYQHGGQRNQTQSTVRTSRVAGGVRFLISECLFHVALSRGVPRWETTSAESPATAMAGDLIGNQRNVSGGSIIKLLK